MSSSASTTTNGVMVVTHVYPAGNTVGMRAPSAPHCGGQVGQVVCSVMGKFQQGYPIALGTIQIMVGQMSFLIGIVMAAEANYFLEVNSGIFVWGATIYIIAGFLTIAADKNLNTQLVNTKLRMNSVATLTAFIDIVLHSVDAAQNVSGISGVMVFYCLLQCIVSFSVSSFADKVVCHATPEVFMVENHLPQDSFVGPQIPFPPPFSPPNYNELFETVGSTRGQEVGIAAPPNDVPPQYSPATIP